MANVFVDETSLENIADAIRSKNGSTDKYKPSEMADAISAISGGGITPTGTKNITENGTHDVTQYASASVNVPNSYTSSDEGKVVNNGALVAQTSQNITSNGTVDTTTNDEVVVSVPNSYSASDEGKVVSNGALVSQTTDTVTTNDTYDTTLINSLTVNVSGSSYEDDVVSGVMSGDYTFTQTAIGRAFANTTGSFNLNFPNVTTFRIGSYQFEKCNAERISAPNFTGSVPNGTFQASYCKYIDIPKATGLGGSVFSTCTNLLSAFYPKATLSSNGTFNGCSKLETAVVRGLGTAGWEHFKGCSKLTSADIGDSSSKLDNTFKGCTLLNLLILRSSSVIPMSNLTALSETLFGSGKAGGTIYIPQSLYSHLGDGTSSDYQSATNWSTIYGYGTITWAQIEGSIYENSYVDGTTIV